MAPEPIEIPLGDLVFDAVVDGPAGGAPVLLLHGFPETSWSWRYVQPQLAAAGHRTLAPDQRGYSPRARPTEPEAYRIVALVADVVALADSQDWDTFHLVGHDWGGAVAWQVAAAHPDRLRSLSVLSTPHPVALAEAKAAGPGPDGEDQAAKSAYMDTFREPGSEQVFLADDSAGFRFALEATGLDADSTDHYVRRFDTAEAMVGPLNWYRGSDPADSEGMGPITTPAMYVWSTADAVLTRRAAEATAGHVEGPYRFEVLEGISHWIPEEAPDQVVPLLLDHLASS
jgi:pimeloyl-ACP methyl ester carboxylesterase